MDRYRKESARRFGISLRNSLKVKYPFVKITSIFLASQYNLRSSTSNTISNETARKWLNGISLPSVHRFQALRDWLGIDCNFIVRYDEFNANKVTYSTVVNESSSCELISRISQSNLFNEQQIEYIKKIAVSLK